MTREFDIDRAFEDWLSEGPSQLPEHAIDRIVRHINETDQRRPIWLPGRNRMNRLTLAIGGMAAALALSLVGAGLFLSLRSIAPGVGGEASPTAAQSLGNASPAPTATSDIAVSELVLGVRSWTHGYDVELAVYADGRVIWKTDERVGYLEQRLTREGAEELRSRAISTGLFEQDHALGLEMGWGNLEVSRGDRSVVLAWGRTSQEVSGLGLQDRFVEATPAQAGELTKLEAFLRDPTAWGLPRAMYQQPAITPYVPTHLWGSYDRARPDLSNLPFAARETVTRHLQPWISGKCEAISIDEAQEVVDALVQAGEIAVNPDIRLGFSFDLGPSFVHFHPALPHEVDCP